MVNGNLAIGTSTVTRGILSVALINGYTRPAVDTSFEILAATSHTGLGFTTANLPDPAFWSVQYYPASAPNSVLVSVAGTGDFNGDHIVDAGDYAVWRNAGRIWRSWRLRHLAPQLWQHGSRPAVADWLALACPNRALSCCSS